MKLRRADWIAGVSTLLVLLLCAGAARLWTTRKPLLANVHLVVPLPDSACVTLTACPFARQQIRERVNVRFEHANLADALHFLARKAAINLAVQPDVHGTVTCEFHHDPAECALLSLVHRSGYGCWMAGSVLIVGRPYHRGRWSPLWHGSRSTAQNGVFVDCLQKPR